MVEGVRVVCVGMGVLRARSEQCEWTPVGKGRGVVLFCGLRY